MVWTVTARGSTVGYGANPLVGDTFTPTEGNIILVASEAWTTYITGCDGWGITFSAIGTAPNLGGYELTVWAGIVGSSPGSDQAQLTTTGGSARHAVCVVEIAGADTSGTIGDAIVQTPVAEAVYNGGSGNAIGAGLSSFASATNATVTLVGSTYELQTFTPQTGFTVYEATSGGTTGHSEIHFDDSEQTAPTYSPVTGSVNDMAMAFELAEAGGGGGIVPLIMNQLH